MTDAPANTHKAKPGCRVRIDDQAKRQVWAQSGGYCQNPQCATKLFIDEGVTFGELAHVIPASPGGPRDVPVEELSLNERAAGDNVIVLCANCHTVVDKAPSKFPASMLREWKRDHAAAIEGALSVSIYEDRAACRAAILPLLEENRAIFKLYGPNANPLSDEAAARWRRAARNSLIPNNYRVLRIIAANQHLLNDEEREVFAIFKIHVRELDERHNLDIWDGHSTRYPVEFSTILED